MKPILRHDWTLSEVGELYRTPLLELVFQAASVHRAHHDSQRVQMCKLISVKTGACPEDCSYCSQSSRYKTEVKATPLMEREEVVAVVVLKALGMTHAAVPVVVLGALVLLPMAFILVAVSGTMQSSIWTIGYLTQEGK